MDSSAEPDQMTTVGDTEPAKDDGAHTTTVDAGEPGLGDAGQAVTIGAADPQTS
jgi:hypothetical protein